MLTCHIFSIFGRNTAVDDACACLYGPGCCHDSCGGAGDTPADQTGAKGGAYRRQRPYRRVCDIKHDCSRLRACGPMGMYVCIHQNAKALFGISSHMEMTFCSHV